VTPEAFVHPVTLSSPRLRLDQPQPADAQRVFEYCQDPVFEHYLAALPWPYRLEDAIEFVTVQVPAWWAARRECTWAIRAADTPDLLGVIALRLPEGASATTGVRAGSIGFWLGAPHRGRGLIGEAQGLVLDWAFAGGLIDVVHWECVVGNLDSARVAHRAGFRFTATAPSLPRYRDGSHPLSWHAVLRATDDRTPRPGWPAEVVGA
jgi:RimJ/RimL family protein N-acetyltransferase